MRLGALALFVLLEACVEPSVIGREGDRSTHAGGPGADQAYDVGLDGDGNSYVVGGFEGSIVLGPDAHVAGPSGLGTYLASFDREGRYRWSRSWSATRFTLLTQTRVEGDELFAIGYVGGTLTTSFGTVDAGTWQNLVVLRLDRGGHELAPPLLVASVAGNVQGKAIDVRDGRIAIVGHYVGDVDLGAGLLGASPPLVDNGLVGVLETPGRVLWSRGIAGAVTYFESAALDAEGGLFAAGVYRDGAIFGVAAAGGDDGVLVAFDPSGTERWHATFASAGADSVQALALAPGGDVVVGGRVSGPLGGRAALGGSDAFVARLAPDGTTRWVRTFGGTADDGVAGITVAGSGEIVASGYFDGTMRFGSAELVSSGESDALVFALGPDGTERWARRFGGPGADVAMDVSTDGREVVVTGTFRESADFGAGPVVSTGSTDVFLLRFVP